MRRLIPTIVSIMVVTPALADFERWTAEVEKDPFSGGTKVIADYMSSMRSGVFIFCDSATDGIRVRAIPGFAMEPGMSDLKPMMEFAIDGKRLISSGGRVVSVGDGIAAAESTLVGVNADIFVDAFAGAKKQVAIKDGISDAPHLLRASGSTASGKQLSECIKSQK